MLAPKYHPEDYQIHCTHLRIVNPSLPLLTNPQHHPFASPVPTLIYFKLPHSTENWKCSSFAKLRLENTLAELFSVLPEGKAFGGIGGRLWDLGVYLDTLTVKIVCMGKETSWMCFGVVRTSRLVSGGRIGGVMVIRLRLSLSERAWVYFQISSRL